MYEHCICISNRQNKTHGLITSGTYCPKYVSVFKLAIILGRRENASLPVEAYPHSLWREEAAKLKIKKVEIDRMASAFEHDDLEKAIK